LLAELKSLGERGGAALGDAYALAARAVSTEIERFEDLGAERRFRAASKKSLTRKVTP
jgi:hypothetical protein